MKRRKQVRRLTILTTVVIIAISLGIGIYFVATSGGSSKLDAFDSKPVSSADMSSLMAVSGQPYGPGYTIAMQQVLQRYSGAPFVSAGKPTVVYVGGEYCPFCAVTRWSLIMALMRFGNLTNLHYTTSSNSEGDYATFTFVGSSYASKYISFRGFEEAGRSNAPLQTVPSNYSSIWLHFGGGVPFMDFGNSYVTAGSVIADPSILGGKNWTSILNDVSTSTSTGLLIREGANLITAVICKVTQGAPASVCSASPIESETSSIAGPVSGAMKVGTVGPASSTLRQPSWQSVRRLV